MLLIPIYGVEHLAGFCNGDVENALLVKWCSAQNRAKSVALSIAIRGARGLGEKSIAYSRTPLSRLVKIRSELSGTAKNPGQRNY